MTLSQSITSAFWKTLAGKILGIFRRKKPTEQEITDKMLRECVNSKEEYDLYQLSLDKMQQ